MLSCSVFCSWAALGVVEGSPKGLDVLASQAPGGALSFIIEWPFEVRRALKRMDLLLVRDFLQLLLSEYGAVS